MTEQKVKLNCRWIACDRAKSPYSSLHPQGTAAFAIIPNRSQTAGASKKKLEKRNCEQLAGTMYKSTRAPLRKPKVAEFIFKQAAGDSNEISDVSRCLSRHWRVVCAGVCVCVCVCVCVVTCGHPMKVEDIEEELLQELALARGEQDRIRGIRVAAWPARKPGHASLQDTGGDGANDEVVEGLPAAIGFGC